MEHILEVVWRSAFAFGVMIAITRLLGKATISQMTYHDFIAAITLGGITANVAFNLKINVWQLLAALLTFGSIAYVLMLLALKSRLMRKWFSGQPTVLIQNGKILEKNMKKMKLNLDTLNQELREKNIFNIDEVDYAILELNGKISVLRKPEYLPVVHKDLQLALGTKQTFPVELIMDGKLIEDNFRQTDVTEDWLMSQIQQKGTTIEKINYAVKSTNGQLFIDEYKDELQKPVDRE